MCNDDIFLISWSYKIGHLKRDGGSKFMSRPKNLLWQTEQCHGVTLQFTDNLQFKCWWVKFVEIYIHFKINY